MKPAINMLRAWSKKRAPLANPDEYMVNKPAHANKKIPKAKGPSKPLSKGIKR
jgi:hypothetical protein